MSYRFEWHPLKAASNIIMNTEEPFDADLHDELRPEYSFDYRKARPNRFVATPQEDDGRLMVVLEPDVARVFTTTEAVNAILRALIEHMPQETKNAA